jgi:23S rRNA (cytosine1962-C5)-methyltransferase
VTQARAGSKQVVLQKDLARALHGGHPWVYREALRPPERAVADGEMVLVVTRAGRPVGRGFWSDAGPIAVRMLTTDARDDIAALVPARLRVALERRRALLGGADTDAFRWVHGEADLLPGVHLDVYGAHASARFDGAGAERFYLERLPELGGTALPQALLEAGAAVAPPLPLASVIARGGRGNADLDVDVDVDEGSDRQARALAGTLPRGEIEVKENGLRLGVDLVRGQKGGLFLDQRDNRQRVRALAGGKRVLNLYGYTGGFSVYAAAGGAAHTTTVDVARAAIAAAHRNFTRNGLPAAEPAAAFVVEDVFAFLTREARKRQSARAARWEMVICDPPSFAPSRRAVPRALGAYRRLHRLCAAVLAPGGMLLAASCSSHVGEAAFLTTIEAGCRDAGRRFRLRAVHGAAPDHPVLAAFPEGHYLKLALGSVE